MGDGCSAEHLCRAKCLKTSLEGGGRREDWKRHDMCSHNTLQYEHEEELDYVGIHLIV